MKRYIHVTYCDDIRREIGNKISLIGLYGSQLQVPEFPVVLPKLVIRVIAVTPAVKPFQSFRIRVLQDESELIDTGEIANQLKPPSETLPSVADSLKEPLNQCLTYDLIFNLSPFQITGPSTLRVRGLTEDGEIKGLGLQVVRSSEPSSP